MHDHSFEDGLLENSSTYRAIYMRGYATGLETAFQEGRIFQAKKSLLLIGTRRFGTPPTASVERINSIESVDYLEGLAYHIWEEQTWEEWLGL